MTLSLNDHSVRDIDPEASRARCPVAAHARMTGGRPMWGQWPLSGGHRTRTVGAYPDAVVTARDEPVGGRATLERSATVAHERPVPPDAARAMAVQEARE
jgi:hypothetical protein